ncbi:ATP-binding cassette domain-containing protein [Bacillus cereus group sp. BfR-BA-01380]|uniref:ATP-binding cassette domain-containing protein n=1 Tax=Bacillus cereus group sp. BfR-BA-01380 TaxID=2920324 RepID=UPI0037C0E75E
MSSYIIKTKDLTKKYKNQTLVDQLNMEVKQGEIYGFLGPNGAGKTTTIRMLLGLIRPTNGEVKIFNQELNQNRMSILKKVGALGRKWNFYMVWFYVLPFLVCLLPCYVASNMLMGDGNNF